MSFVIHKIFCDHLALFILRIKETPICYNSGEKNPPKRHQLRNSSNLGQRLKPPLNPAKLRWSQLLFQKHWEFYILRAPRWAENIPERVAGSQLLLQIIWFLYLENVSSTSYHIYCCFNALSLLWISKHITQLSSIPFVNIDNGFKFFIK